MDNQDLLQTISKKLGVLIALQLQEKSEKFSVSEGVELLTRFGMTPTEIADILNTSTNTVNVMRSRLKNKKK
ncbi:MAG: hypothetical protein A2845_03985 [Candidatus Lloydbacteria bacterium RIFCSPHIGHO2_01_FULL_49_22]|uniref:Uncharacterized protein n=1 Tax=Candidatus Lloydbacteria bacterium RIFCSPHIGHO2_01_FULL_49_22 TaxID=1798658 RepID=A0A1G2CX29_9BACT|nr:MAG: hypothetical protein A2845_03985 [Candidatus Lloydbacteria bacterium RIFCSPHIGHO2_01_FULL_49_22]OGZ09086.1 MAG: hypothetical protein A3C14_03820 [Candidatus Lloydbacteria bacterium RIFCSPHIGHO2_02_FULL_50_18]